MMNNTAIRVKGLSKQYRIGQSQVRYHSLRETLANSVSASFGRLRSIFRRSAAPGSDGENTVWALKDVSFEIGHGEVVGIIGRNGAGKSTLLKILSRITEPTRGFADIYGRVGSLLEVGTGFHGELTGRENIYLNGAILGMRKAEISRKFDDIVSFAEVEKFIDTPVKHYSSGMYLRLAFAVAAYLEPEILIVDEVLAVGDANFQRKCLDKMQDVGQQGRTVLLVSHNMSAITRLCPRAILINEGKLIEYGPSDQVVSHYLTSGLATTATREWPDPATAPGGKVARLRAVRVRNEDGQVTHSVDIRCPVSIEMEYEVLKSGYTLLPYLKLHTQEGIIAFEAIDLDAEWRSRQRPSGLWKSSASIPGNLLSEGIQFVSAGLITLDPVTRQFSEPEVVAFQVFDNMDGDSARGEWTGIFPGVVRPLLNWSTRFSPRELTPSRQHEYLFECVNDSVMTRTMEGRINVWNRSAEELYGWRKEEAIGRVSHDLLQTQFPKPLEEIESELARNGRWEGKLVHTTRDGGRVVVQSRWTLDLTGEPGEVVEISARSSDDEDIAGEIIRHLGFLLPQFPVASLLF